MNPGNFGTEPPISEQLSNSDRNLRSELLPQESEPPCHEGDESGDVRDSISGRSVPTSVARHGPGFLNLLGEEKSQIRRLHHIITLVIPQLKDLPSF